MAAIGGVSPISHLLNAAATGATSGATSAGAAGAAAPAAVTGTTTVGGGTTPGATSAGGGSFLDAIGDALGQLNTQLTSADQAVTSFATGGSADLHTVMLELQQASIGLKTGIAVRDKLLEAYQDLMRLQI